MYYLGRLGLVRLTTREPCHQRFANFQTFAAVLTTFSSTVGLGHKASIATAIATASAVVGLPLIEATSGDWSSTSSRFVTTDSSLMDSSIFDEADLRCRSDLIAECCHAFASESLPTSNSTFATLDLSLLWYRQGR